MTFPFISSLIGNFTQARDQISNADSSNAIMSVPIWDKYARQLIKLGYFKECGTGDGYIIGGNPHKWLWCQVKQARDYPDPEMLPRMQELLTKVHRQFLHVIRHDPSLAYSYAAGVLHKPWPDGEAAIASDPETAFLYAQWVIHGAWPPGEAAIKRDDRWSKRYDALLATTNRRS